MNSDEILEIVKKHLIGEWNHLPIPLDSDRVLEMINTALKNAKIEIDYLNSQHSKP